MNNAKLKENFIFIGDPPIKCELVCPLCGNKATEIMAMTFVSQNEKGATRTVEESMTCCNVCGSYLLKMLKNKAYKMMEEKEEYKNARKA